MVQRFALHKCLYSIIKHLYALWFTYLSFTWWNTIWHVYFSGRICRCDIRMESYLLHDFLYYHHGMCLLPALRNCILSNSILYCKREIIFTLLITLRWYGFFQYHYVQQSWPVSTYTNRSHSYNLPISYGSRSKIARSINKVGWYDNHINRKALAFWF